VSDPRLRSIFGGALDRPTAEERARFLDEACGSDVVLRQRVEMLLQAHEEAGSFFGDPAKKAVPEATAVVQTEKAGDRIGRYKLLQEIGEGGCGLVYMAEQEEPVRRRVALKVIKLGMDTREVITRFEAERQALALMDHPNIARVLDAGATDAGRPYFVMELVRGVRITEFCDENKLSTEERLKLFIQVCQAIQHAHQKGIIHRDIKPSNILVTINDGQPVPKVIDFGIAKATQGRLTDKTLFTAFEQFIGTPAYMSPEQAVMTSLDIDTRSDIYSLGVLLYELLTGTTPFDTRRLLASGLEEMRRTIREEDPVRPSARLSTLDMQSATELLRHRQERLPALINLVRGDLDWIVMKCLGKDRSRRYETANGLARDIQRHLDREPIAARPPSQLYRFERLARRNKLAFTLASLVMIALLGGLAVATWLLAREKITRQRAVAAERAAQTEAAKSKEVARFLTDMLEGVGPSVALGRDTTMLREILDRTAKRLNGLTNQPAVEAELRARLGNTYWRLAEYSNAVAMHDKALALRKQLYGEESSEVADSLNDLGKAYLLQGKYPEAVASHTKALELRRKLLGTVHADTATSLNNLAEALRRRMYLSPQTEALFQEALAIRRKLFGDVSLEVAQTLTDYGLAVSRARPIAEISARRLEQAQAMHREALAIRRQLLGDVHPEVAVSLDRLGSSLRYQHKFAEAEAVIREGLEMRRKLLPREHTDLADSLNNLANVLISEKRWAEAEDLNRQSLAMRRKLLGDQHYEVTDAIGGLLTILRFRGKLGDAVDLMHLIAMNRIQPHTGLDTPMARVLTALRREGKTNEIEMIVRQLEQWNVPALTMMCLEAGWIYENGGGVVHDPAETLKWYGKAAEHGMAEAQFQMGRLHATGKGTARDEVEAAKWYRKAADQGHVAAQLNLAKRYQNGRGVPMDQIEAVQWYRRAAEQTNVIAQYHLGLIYTAGRGVTKDEPEALKWFLRAAEAGYQQAQLKLGQMYNNGQGVVKNEAEGAKWFQKATGDGTPNALNEVAWILATAGDETIRNGTNAIAFAEKAVAATGRTNANYIDTLAAAYAEAGQFTNAVTAERAAIALLSTNEQSWKTQLEQRLQLFQSGTPHRE
jgi:TPR repeat protein/serine/threonine protein kinase